MTVEELEDILARLPKDMIVKVGFTGDHVMHVETVAASSWPVLKAHRCETGRCRVTEMTEEKKRVPPYVRIFGPFAREQRTARTDDPPEFDLLGRHYWREPRRHD